MRKYIGLAVLAVLAVFLVAGLASAATGQPAAKATAKVGDVHIIEETEYGPVTILANTLKTPNQKDLFIDVSLECGLYTRTKVKGKEGEVDTASATAGVYVQVLVDGEPAYPGEVVFCEREQGLSARFGGVLENCVDLDGDGHITIDECEWTDEWIELVLETMNANSFNFIMDDLSAGEHMIEVQAWIDSAIDGDANAWGSIGKGSMTVEEVRLIKDEDIELPAPE